MDTVLRRRLAKLSLLLGSDKSGEVTAAAAAIGRALTGAKLDFHSLADAIREKPAGHRKREERPPCMPGAVALAMELLNGAKAENARLKVQIECLQARVAELEERYESRPISRVIYCDEFTQPRGHGRGSR